MNRTPGITHPHIPIHLPKVTPGPFVHAVTASGWSRRLALLGLLGLILWAGGLQLSTPAVVPATAPATEFSAERAMAHLRVIAAEPRPAGSEGNARVRAYLVEQLSAMGLTPEVQTAAANIRFEGADDFSAGTVHNVIARVPGTASTGAIALNAHYDGGSTGPAAGDNGSGVVAVLETLRAVLAGPALANDLIAVFTDAEEDGDLGAVAFTGEHPWARDVRLAINYEAQGANGPAFLYVTSPDNDWLVAEFIKVAPDPSGYSFMVATAELLESTRAACDLQDYIDHGAAGLGFIFAGDATAYHTVRDNTANIDAGSIQQEGGYTLALVRHFGAEDLANLPTSSGDRVFFNILPGVLVHYAATRVLPLAAVITLAFAALLVLAARRGHLTAGHTATAFAATLAGTLVSILAVVALWFAVRTINPDYQVTLVGNYQSTLHIVALAFAALAAQSTVWALLRRWLRPVEVIAGGLLVWTLLLWATSLLVPGISYLAAWPLLFALLAFALLALTDGRVRTSWRHVAVLAIAAVPALLLLPGTLYQALGWLYRFEGLSGMPILGLVALFLAPLALLLIPQLELLAGDSERGPRRWAVPGTAAALVVALFGFGIVTSGFDAEHPRPNHIAYELNADNGTARWVSADQRLDSWTEQFFPASPAKQDFEPVAGFTVSAFAAPAPVAALAAPEATLLSDTTTGDSRTVTVRVTSPRGAPRMEATVRAVGPITGALIDGKPLDLAGYAPATDGELQFHYAAVPAAGFDLTLTVAAGARVTLTLADTSYGLPEVPGVEISPRPADTMPAPIYPRDATVTRRSITFEP